MMTIDEAKKALIGKTLECSYNMEDKWYEEGIISDIHMVLYTSISIREPVNNGTISELVLKGWESIEKLACNDYARETIYNDDTGDYEFTTYRIRAVDMTLDEIKEKLIGKYLEAGYVFGEIFAIRQEEDNFIVSVHNRNASPMLEQQVRITLTPKEIEHLAIDGYYEWTHFEPRYEENEIGWGLYTMTEVLDGIIRIIGNG